MGTQVRAGEDGPRAAVERERGADGGVGGNIVGARRDRACFLILFSLPSPFSWRAQVAFRAGEGEAKQINGIVKDADEGRSTSVLKFTNCRILKDGKLINDDLWVQDGKIIDEVNI